MSKIYQIINVAQLYESTLISLISDLSPLIYMIQLRKFAQSSLIGLTSTLPFSRFYFGVIQFNLPDLGEKIKEGTIKKIYVKQGDAVEQFQKLADVASDKQFTEITASNTGVIRKIFYKEEDVCQVGDLFLEIYVKDQSETTPSDSTVTQVPDVKTVDTSVKKEAASSGNSIQATPYVRGLIKNFGLDITKIRGTGEGGRILEADVQNLLKKTEQIPKGEVKQPKQKIEVKEEAPKISTPAKDTSSGKSPTYTSSEGKSVTMSSFEKGMQKSMTESNTIPHLYLHQEFDITEVQKMRKSLKESNKKVTVMGILIKTFSLALKQYPRMNSLYQPSVNPFEYVIHPNHNISIAIDSPNGLVVPHIKNVNTLNLVDIQNELERLRNLAKEAKLTAKELQGGTVCLSNIGTIGGTHACPLILPPQVCIVAIGKLQSVPKFKNGQVVERKVINLSFGCDHRVVDGATVARFSNQWKQLMENPYLSIAQMI